MISIVSLIYKSTVFADSVYNSVMEFTPLIQSGQAEFFFIANDATDKVLEHLKTKNYKHFINNNPKLTEAELVAKGIGWPEYIHRVYRGWNEAIKHSHEIVVLVNSDNMFSPNWLENLLKHSSDHTVVCSQLVERRHPRFPVFPGAYHGEFGTHPNNYNKAAFLDFCKKHSMDNKIKVGGAYMPCMLYKSIAEKAGMYPEGNVHAGSWNNILRYGDEDFFFRLKQQGVIHITSLDSISYHFKEGEMEE